jgi:hypothetical protein
LREFRKFQFRGFDRTDVSSPGAFQNLESKHSHEV